MTNPGNIVRVRARNGGRASVYEANGWAQAYTSGLLEGNGVTQNTVADMKVLVGGSTTKPDVVLAVNPAGYRIALDLIGQQALTLTTPASNKRISAIVAYTDDLSLATTEDTVTGSPASCGLIVVNGTAAANPVEPTDAQIRTAITSDGATGSQAAYCVIATVLVADDATVIDNSLITIKNVNLAANKMVNASNVDFTTFGCGNYSTTETDTGFTWIDGKNIYKKTVNIGTLPNNTKKSVSHGITNLDKIIKIDGITRHPGNNITAPLPFTSLSESSNIQMNVVGANIEISTGVDRTGFTDSYATLYYTKS